MKKLLALIIISILSGCAISNEGKVDFRKTNNNYSLDNVTNKQRLIAKNISLGDKLLFKKGDLLSLNLKAAFIKDFSENVVEPYFTKAFTEQWGRVEGEIAIVANAFEETSDKQLSFTNMREGRVVFYSEDVHEGQILNFDNMPIYGPITYDGAPLAFRIAIFELDVFSEQAKSMLNNVAEWGGKSYPPASPVLGVLNTIGSTLFDGDQTDTEFRYTMVLDPKNGSETINNLKLEVGNYILIRIDDRGESIAWEKLVFDDNEGKVYIKNDQGKYVVYTENTYVVIAINKNLSTKSVDLEEFDFGILMSALKTKDAENAGTFTSNNNSIINIVSQRSQLYNFIKAKEILVKLKDNNISFGTKRKNAIQLFEMIANSIDKTNICLNDNEKVDDVVDIDSSVKTSNQNHLLSNEQIEYLIEDITQYLGSNINSSNWRYLDLDNIYIGFHNNTDECDIVTLEEITTQQDKILNLVVPFKIKE